VVVQSSDGATRGISLTPDRSVGAVTRDVLAAVGALAGPVEIKVAPSEVPWTVPLDEDEEHHTYEPAQVATYLAAATRAATALAAIRARYPGRKTPVNAWWGSFDLAVSLFADQQETAVGWWPGDHRYPKAAFYAYVRPAQQGFAEAPLAPARWDATLGEFLLDWDDVVAGTDPQRVALDFLVGATRHAHGASDG
jgi:hypothetical protein